jgi:hypothetical protein
VHEEESSVDFFQYLIFDQDCAFLVLWRVILLSASLVSPYYYAYVSHRGYEKIPPIIIVLECIFAFDISTQFLTSFTPDGETVPVRDFARIAAHYMAGDFYFDLFPTFPITFFLDNSKSEIWRLLYWVKVIRIATALEIYNVRAMVNFFKNRNKEKVLRQIERDPSIADDPDTDYNGINSFFNMSYSLNIFKLFLMILSLSYFAGMFWFTLCEQVYIMQQDNQ